MRLHLSESTQLSPNDDHNAIIKNEFTMQYLFKISFRLANWMDLISSVEDENFTWRHGFSGLENSDYY